MQEPSIRTSRLAIAGGLAVAIALGGAGFVIGRSTAPQPELAAPIAIIPPTPELTPASEGVLRRADLIELAENATDALTSGETGDRRIAPAVGQRFELVLPFGCSGPNESGPAMRWRYDDASETLRVTVEPTSWDPGQWGLDSARYEIAEGFWISRPWSSSEACPKNSSLVPPDTDAITLPGQTLAIAQFFADGDNRDARRDGRPYELVKRISAREFDGSRGFLLRVTGRIEGLPDGDPIRCVQPAGAQQRPVCAIGVRMDEVAVENPVTGDVIGSWQLDTAG
jgi:hypothetical protein